VFAAILLRERHARDQARILRAESERHQFEKSMLEAKLAVMQAQVEPHFLFNTLANVQHLVDTDPPAASRMLESLIKYLRAALPQMREAATNLGREVDMARVPRDPPRAHGARGSTSRSTCPMRSSAAPSRR
jgi:sensor histidine kinase YesM